MRAFPVLARDTVMMAAHTEHTDRGKQTTRKF